MTGENAVGVLYVACIGAIVIAFGIGACEARVAVSSRSTDSSRAEGETLPRMHAIPTDTTSGSVEHVRGFRVFQAGDCTVWRFTDSVGVHYLAEGRETKFSDTHAVSCSVAR